MGITMRRASKNPVLIVTDQKASGTHGGGFTSGSRVTRALNSVIINEIPGASVASNQITLPPGTYDILAAVPAYAVGGHVAVLRNVTDSTDVLTGSASYSYNGGAAVEQTYSHIIGRFTITSQKVLSVEHECTTTQATYGLGTGHALGEPNVYTQVRIEKVA